MTKSKIFYGILISAVFCGAITGILLVSRFKYHHTPNNKIISIAAACTEIIFAIGADDRLVGVDQYSINYALAGAAYYQDAPGDLENYPIEVPNITNVGTTSSLNLEMVAALNPSIVFSWDWASTANNAIEDLNITVFKINPQSIEDVLNLTTDIGLLLNKTTEAAAVTSEIQERIDNITSALDHLTEGEKPLVYYELSSLGKTVGNGTITNEMIFVAGGINLAGNESIRYPQLDEEYIVARNADIIVVVSYGASVEDIKSRAGWENITAVENNDVYKIESGWVTASPRLVLGLEQLAEWFHPGEF